MSSQQEKVVLELEVVIGTYDSLLTGMVYDMLEEKGRLRPSFSEKGHTGSVRCLAASPAGVLASGGSDEIIKLYNMRQHTEVGTLMQHEGTVNYLEFHQDKHLFSASDDGSICMWRCHDWSCVHHMTGHKGAVYCISVHPSGKLALSVGKDRTVRTWDLVNGQCAYIKRLAKAAAELVVWNQTGDGYLLVTNDTFALYNVQTGAIVLQVTVGQHINSIVFIQDSVVAVGSESTDISLYSTDTGELISTLTGHTNRVKCLSFVPGVNLLFSGSSDGTIRIWNILLDDLSNSVCICVSAAITGRLTSMTLVYPQELQGEEKVKRRRPTKDIPEPVDELLMAVPSEEEAVTNRKIGKSKKRSAVSFHDCKDEREVNTERRKKKRKRKGTDSSLKPTVTIECEEENY